MGTFERVVIGIVRYARHVDAVAFRVEDGNVRASLGVEVNGWYLTETADGVLDGGCEYLPDALLVLELDFGLCGVDVHVDVSRVEVEIDEVRHLHPFRYEPLEGIGYCLVKVGVLHVAPVDEEEVMNTLFSADSGLPTKPEMLQSVVST